jgi:hypothetical protein
MGRRYSLGVDETAQRSIANIPTVYIGIASKSKADWKRPRKTTRNRLRSKIKNLDQEFQDAGADFALGKVNGRTAYVMPVPGLRERLGEHYSQNKANVVGIGEIIIAQQKAHPGSLDRVAMDGFLHSRTRREIKAIVPRASGIDLRGLIKGDSQKYLLALADLLGYSIFRYLHRLRKARTDGVKGKFRPEEYFVDALKDSPFAHLLIEPRWERYEGVF